MYIRRAQIDGFGVLVDQTIPQLPPGLSVFLGSNEAGKSTCLDFFRAMLAGYSRKKVEQRVPISGHASGRASGRAFGAGGTLTLHTDRCGTVRLTRRPGSHGGLLTLTDEAGNPLDAELATALLHGVTPDLYRNIYGFSLTELQEFSTLSAEGARNVLLGASTGHGLRPPSRLLDDLSGRMGALYLPDGRKPPLNEALKELEQLRATLRAHQRDTARYDALSEELEDRNARLAEVRGQRAALDAEVRVLERRLAVWQQWQELLETEGQLARLPVVVQRFPHDGAARLERERERAAERHARATGLRAQRTALDDALAALTPDPQLAEAAPALRALLERKASHRSARLELPALLADMNRNRADRERLLAALGADWTPGRVRGFDRSLFTREVITSHESALDVAGADLRQAQTERQRRAEEHETARHAAELAAASVKALGTDPGHIMDAESAERLRGLRAQAGTALAELPGLRAELAVQQSACRKALADISPRWTTDSLHGFDTSPVAREALGAQARSVIEASSALRDAQRHAEAQARQLEEDAALRDRAVAAAQAITAPTREELDRRAGAVRRLRRVADALTLEAERAAEAARHRRDHATAAPVARRNTPLLALGGVLGTVGLLGAVALLLFRQGIVTVDALPALAALREVMNGGGLPAVLACAVVAVCGMALVLAGMPRRDAAAVAAHEARGQALAEHIRTLAAQRDALRAEARRLLAETGLPADGAAATSTAHGRLRDHEEQDSPDNLDGQRLADLSDGADWAERTLEQHRELRTRRERAEAEAETRRAAHAAQQARHMQALHTLEDAQETLRQARDRWEARCITLALPESLPPEATHGLFDRVEACAARIAQLDALTARVNAHTARLGTLAHAALPVPPLAPAAQAFLSSAEPSETAGAELLAAVDHLLAHLREAEATRQERERAQAELAARTERHQQARTALEAAQAALAAAEAAAANAQAAWRAWLTERGLAPDLTPATAREALTVMDQWLRLDNEAAALATRRAALEAELAALEGPLGQLAATCGWNISGDPVAGLDAFAAAAQEAVNAIAERQRLAARRTELLAELQEAEAAHNAAETAIAELLTAGDATDPEDFLRRAAAYAERQELLRRAGDLAAHLCAAQPDHVGLTGPTGHSGQPRTAQEEDTILAALRAELATTDLDAMRARHTALTAELADLASAETDLVGKVAALRAQLDLASTADEVAALRRQEAALLESARQMAQEWSRNALARHLVDTARRRYERERQPHVIRAAADIFRHITGGQWQSIAASLEDGVPRAVPADGEPVPHEHLSRGAREQLYLALRLGFVRTRALHAEPLPLIMDDILVNFDPERAARTAAALAALCGQGARQDSGQSGNGGNDHEGDKAADGEAGDNGGKDGNAAAPGGPHHQILFFTCHPHTVDMLRAAAPGAALFTVDRGAITAAS